MEVTAKNCYWCGIYGDVRPAWRDGGDHGTILDLCSTCRDRDVPPVWKKCRDYISGFDPQLYPKAAHNRQTPRSSAASELVMRKARVSPNLRDPPEYWDPPIYSGYQIAALHGRNPIPLDIAQVSAYGGTMVEYKHECLQQRRKDAVAFHAARFAEFPWTRPGYLSPPDSEHDYDPHQIRLFNPQQGPGHTVTVAELQAAGDQLRFFSPVGGYPPGFQGHTAAELQAAGFRSPQAGRLLEDNVCG